MVVLHINLMVDHYGEKIGLLVFRKHLAIYLSDYLLTAEIRSQIFSIVDQSKLEAYIYKLLKLEENNDA